MVYSCTNLISEGVKAFGKGERGNLFDSSIRYVKREFRLDKDKS